MTPYERALGDSGGEKLPFNRKTKKKVLNDLWLIQSLTKRLSKSMKHLWCGPTLARVVLLITLGGTMVQFDSPDVTARHLRCEYNRETSVTNAYFYFILTACQ